MRSVTGSLKSENLHQLVRLAKEQTGDELSVHEQAGLERLEQALASRRARGNRTWMWAAAFAAAVGGTLLLFLPRLLGTRALSVDVVSGTVSEGGYVRPAQGGDALLRFSDGSEVKLDSGARARVTELKTNGARVLLESGRARVHVVHRADTKWAIDAGPFTVQVTGTEFDLSWASVGELLDLHLHNGSVVVSGPFTLGGVGVGPGQHLIANLKGSITLETDTAEPETTPRPSTTEAADEGAAAAELTGGDATGESPVTESERARSRLSNGRHAANSNNGWSAMVARGQFASVLEEAERRGIATTLSRAPLDDLAALADAARYMRRDDWARRAYHAERGRFPASRRGREAAFFLGGLAEGDSELSAALEWYDRYLSDSPRGTYASQALGHKMVLIRKLQGAAAAAQIAGDYLERFPDGPYASGAKKLLAP
jgi:hypothetical protein